MRRANLALVIALLCLVLITAVAPMAWGSGKGNSGGKSSGGPAKVQVKISTQFANFPLPIGAQLVPRDKHKAGSEWTVYRAGLSILSITSFYRTNMPGHGWKLKTNKGNSWTWARGNRTISVVYIRLGSLLTYIQVREYR